MSNWVKQIYRVSDKLPSLQQHQKVTHATAKVATSKAFERSNPRNSVSMCSSMTGGHRGCFDESGTTLARPVVAKRSNPCPNHGVLCRLCQKCKPASQFCVVVAVTFPAQEAMKDVRRWLEAGILFFLGIDCELQYWWKCKRPAP